MMLMKVKSAILFFNKNCIGLDGMKSAIFLK